MNWPVCGKCLLVIGSSLCCFYWKTKWNGSLIPEFATAICFVNNILYVNVWNFIPGEIWIHKRWNLGMFEKTNLAFRLLHYITFSMDLTGHHEAHSVWFRKNMEIWIWNTMKFKIIEQIVWGSANFTESICFFLFNCKKVNPWSLDSCTDWWTSSILFYKWLIMCRVRIHAKCTCDDTGERSSTAFHYLPEESEPLQNWPSWFGDFCLFVRKPLTTYIRVKCFHYSSLRIYSIFQTVRSNW